MSEAAKAETPHQKRSRAKGRFASRAELLQWVWASWFNTPSSISDMAEQCRTTYGTIRDIIDSKEGMPSEIPPRPQALR